MLNSPAYLLIDKNYRLRYNQKMFQSLRVSLEKSPLQLFSGHTSSEHHVFYSDEPLQYTGSYQAMNVYHRPRLCAGLRNSVPFLLCSSLFLTAFFLTILGLATNATNTAAAAEAQRDSQQQLIVPPFEIQTKTPHPYLQTGLANILATRISTKTGHIVVPGDTEIDSLGEMLHRQDYAAVQKKLQGTKNTYLLAGILQEKEEDYEITVHVFGDREIKISFSRSFNRLESALSAVDELSLDIAEKIFAVPRPKKTEIVASNDGFKGFRTAHPEKILKEKGYSDEQEEKENIGATMTEPERKNTGFGIRSSRKDILPSSTAVAMAAGDLDNDGTVEFVVLEKENLALYHRSPNASFQRIAFQPVARHLGLHTVYLADLDRNGLKEIYIGASSGTRPASQILEWDGERFRPLYQNAPYYLRPSADAQGRPFLLGQEGVVGKTKAAAFYSLQREPDGSLRKIKQLTFPSGFNIYDFIRADLDRDGILEFVGITPGNKLTVIDNSGRTLWKSEKQYGASREILGTLSSTVDGDRNPTNNPPSVYMHSRIIAQDLNGDGTPEIILGRNRLADTIFFRRLRAFEGSSIIALRWSQGGMEPFWESPKLSGYTVDFQMLRDAGSPGGFRLFSLEQEHTNNLMSFWKTKESRMHSYILAGTANQ